MQKGNIGVTTENIFPVIKKFLYSDHEIFLREMVSNAVDATQKLKTLKEKGDFNGELGDLTVHVSLDADKGTLTISDRGIGMTAEEIDKYINQIAFSGVTDFLDKYKDTANAIIGHFGLGFYSSFMVSKKVEIVTKSYREGEKAVKWSCDGSPEFTIEEVEKADRGSDIILYIDDDCKEFLEKSTIERLLNKYCKFLPVSVAFGKKTEWKDGKQVDTEEDNIINNVEPLWTKTPSTLKDEDYKSFYRTLYPMQDEPLFWIHLNVDYPFNLTGILYFPRIKQNIDIQRNKIQLYCNQVFVTDQVEGIVPEFLTLLHGVIDSPDIPLNVSRSYLQSDRDVKKISTYITKKVADKLIGMYKNHRDRYEELWDDLSPFIKFGCLRDNKFDEKMKDHMIFKNLEDKYITLPEYLEAAKDTHENQVFYVSDAETQARYIQMFKDEGIDAIYLTHNIDNPYITMMEARDESVKFARIDSDLSANFKGEALSEEDEKKYTDSLTETFKKALGVENIKIKVESLKDENVSSMLTQSEADRRMAEMMKMYSEAGMGGMGMNLGQDTETLVLNSNNKLVKYVLDNPDEEITPTICSQLYDLAVLANKPLTAEELTRFVARSNEILTKLI